MDTTRRRAADKAVDAGADGVMAVTDVTRRSVSMVDAGTVLFRYRTVT